MNEEKLGEFLQMGGMPVHTAQRQLQGMIPQELLCSLSKCLLVGPWVTDSGQTVSTIEGTIPGVSVKYPNRILARTSEGVRERTEALMLPKGAPLAELFASADEDLVLTLAVFLGSQELAFGGTAKPSADLLFQRAREMGNVIATAASFRSISSDMCGACMNRLTEGGQEIIVHTSAKPDPLSKHHFECVREKMALTPERVVVFFFSRARQEFEGFAGACMEKSGWRELREDGFTLTLLRRYASGWSPSPSVWVHPSKGLLGLLGPYSRFNPAVQAGSWTCFLFPQADCGVSLCDQVSDLQKMGSNESLQVHIVGSNEHYSENRSVIRWLEQVILASMRGGTESD